MYEKEDMKALFKKVNELRADILTKDWKDDKQFIMNGRVAYPYLSADKIKRTIAPLIHEHGLELNMVFSELTERGEVGGFKQHWSIRLDATLIDTDSGASTTTTVYGEAGDVGDKGVNKAQTIAIKQWILSQFLIADGIDPDADSPMRTTTYVPKTHEENEEVKSKVLAKTVEPAPAPPAPKPKAAAPPVPAPPAPKPKAAAPPSPPASVMKPVGEEVAAPQERAMDKIMESLKAKMGEGSLDPEEYGAAVTARDAVTTSAEAIAFIKTYKEMSL